MIIFDICFVMFCLPPGILEYPGSDSKAQGAQVPLQANHALIGVCDIVGLKAVLLTVALTGCMFTSPK